MKVCVVGLGYIGLPTAALISSHGIDVLGIDISQSVVDTINKGDIHIVEPGLAEVVKSVVANGKLKASTTPEEADVFVIAVPTPFKEDHQPNLDYIFAAAKNIAPYIKPGNLIILESTSPVSTTEQMKAVLEEANPSLVNEDVHYAFCPERVLPGNIMAELVSNSRVVGGLTKMAGEKSKAFYKQFVEGEVFETTARTAELCKLVENSFRDVNIAFANELSLICHQENVDVFELIEMANKHPRVNILTPGVGVGGHCIAVDPWFIIKKNPEHSELIKTGRLVNLKKTDWVVEQIIERIESFKSKNNAEPKIACLGLAFKPNIDDLRESPAIDVCEKLLQKGYVINVVEPNIKDHDKFSLIDLEEAKASADLMILLVGHNEFKALSPEDRLLDFCGALR